MGGTWNRLSGKELPGTYINFESTRNDIVGIAERGTVIIPLIGHSYGPSKEFITIYNSSPDAQYNKLGYSVYDPELLMVREALKNAKTVVIYIPSQGTKATGTAGTLIGTAMYGGERGNDLRFTVVANPDAGFDVQIHLDENLMSEYEGITDISEMADDEWMTFTGTLVETPGTRLSGGTAGVTTNLDVSTFLDASEGVLWNTMAFPMEATGEINDPAPSLHEAVKAKIKYLREDVGKYRKAVVPKFYADYEGIICVGNSVKLNDGTEMTMAQVTSWVAGADAGASNTTSNTYLKYNGAVEVVGNKDHATAVESSKKGELFFDYSEEGDVIVKYDINSLTTYKKPKDKTYRKNRVIRVFDTFAESLMLNFPPNKFDNSPTGWDVMEGLGRSILKLYEDVGAIKNVDLDNDFLVDREASTGDETYFIVGLEAVDSAEKLFFTIRTR